MKPDSPAQMTDPVADHHQHGLADDLRHLEETANGMPIELDQMVAALEDRGHAVVILLLATPFVVIPIPGLSTIVGLAVLMLAIGVLLNLKPWLPRFIGKRHVSPEGLHKIVNGTNRVLSKLERFVKPRMTWVTEKSWHPLIGLSLVLSTLALMLPLPIPGNNIPPAIGIVLLALGLLERDGLFVMIGHVYTVLLWIALLAAGFFFWEAIDQYVHRIIGRLSHAFE